MPDTNEKQPTSSPNCPPIGSPIRTPIEKTTPSKWIALPSPAAANDVAPSGPTMIVSAVFMPTCPSWLTTIGSDSFSSPPVARASVLAPAAAAGAARRGTSVVLGQVVSGMVHRATKVSR